MVQGQHTQQVPGGSDESDDQAATAGTTRIDVSSTDELLDEIDDLLEDNAEQFVRSYVQKGGQ